MALKDFYSLPVTELSEMGTFPSHKELQEKEVARSIQKQSVLALPAQGPEGEGEVLIDSASQASTTVQAYGPDKLVSKRAAPATWFAGAQSKTKKGLLVQNIFKNFKVGQNIKPSAGPS